MINDLVLLQKGFNLIQFLIELIVVITFFVIANRLKHIVIYLEKLYLYKKVELIEAGKISIKPPQKLIGWAMDDKGFMVRVPKEK